MYELERGFSRWIFAIVGSVEDIDDIILFDGMTMGELIRLICTSCGASLEQSTDDIHYTCTYCGTKHAIKGRAKKKRKKPRPSYITDDGERDELFEEAARIMVRSQQGSVALLQRKLSVGYTRAARITDQLEEAGIVGAFVGSKAREVLISGEEELEVFLSSRK